MAANSATSGQSGQEMPAGPPLSPAPPPGRHPQAFKHLLGQEGDEVRGRSRQAFLPVRMALRIQGHPGAFLLHQKIPGLKAGENLQAKFQPGLPQSELPLAPSRR